MTTKNSDLDAMLLTHVPISARRAMTLASLLLVVLQGAAFACDTPVFQWALERWGARGAEECYEVVVFHRGELDETTAGTVEWLRKRAWPDAVAEKDLLPANFLVRTQDVDGEMADDLKNLWEAQEKPELPWAVVAYPLATRIPVWVWAGKLDRDVAQKIVDSPLRRKIVERVLDGDAAVWVFVECGDAEKDAAAKSLIESQLESLEKLIELPEPYDPNAAFQYWETSEEGGEEPAAPEPQHPKFSLQVLSKDNAAEAIFRAMLVRTEKDLEEDASKSPAAFPIFGRARVLYALVGDGIHKGNVELACQYITGRCSCEFKWMNPGTDLLVAADWDKVPLSPEMSPEALLSLVAPPTKETIEATPGSAAPEVNVAEPGAASEAAVAELSASEPGSPDSGVGTTVKRSADTTPSKDASRSTLLRNVGITLAVFVVVVGASAFALRRRLTSRG